MEDPYLYRLATLDEWALSEKTGKITKRALDQQDGFYHLSTAGQMILTANLYFSEYPALVALLFSRAGLEQALEWEAVPSRHDKFPHYFGTLQTSQVHKVLMLERAPGGSFGIVTQGGV